MKKLKPTESELAILQILWEEGPSTVREVHEILNRKKESGYTTTLKIMQIMVEKSIATRDASSKVHIYKPNVEQQKVQKNLLKDFVEATFSGSATQLVMQALGNHKTSKEELEQIKELISKIESDKR